MAISRELLYSMFGKTAEKENSETPPPYDNHGFFSQHKDLFECYGINHNTIDPTKITEIETDDGKLCVYGPQRVVCPPERYHLTLHRASLIGNKP